MGKKIGVYLDKILNKNDLIVNIDKVFAQFKDTIVNNLRLEIAEKLLYWLNSWSAYYLKNEDSFNYLNLIRYKKGCVVEVDLGFKVGSEQGGLHYAIVLDNQNDKSSKVLMVIPLESLPEGKSPNNINEKYEVFLGYGIFKEDIEKTKLEIAKLTKKILDRQNKGIEISRLQKTLNTLQKELLKLQKGSVAQISQMCALSKMRIYNPKKIGDKFSAFRLSDEKILQIEEKFTKLYLSKKPQES